MSARELGKGNISLAEECGVGDVICYFRDDYMNEHK
jgi:hypothetical protein